MKRALTAALLAASSLHAQTAYGPLATGAAASVANPTAAIGLAAVNGSATTAMRSDAAPAINPAVSPTWTGTHTFANAPILSGLTGFVSANGSSALTASATIPTSVLSGTITGVQLGTGAALANIGPNGVTAAYMSQANANTLRGNPTGTLANVQDMALPSCSGTGNALQWTSGTGFGCYTGFAAAPGQTYTFPSTNATLARTDAAQTFTGAQTFSNGVSTPGALTLSAGGASLRVGASAATVMAYNAPSIASGFGTSPTIQAGGGSASFTVTVGGGGASGTGVLTMPSSGHTGWICKVDDQTTISSTVAFTRETANTLTSVTVAAFNSSLTASAWNAGDVLQFQCLGY